MQGTAKPMKLPSGQVIWVRVDDDEDEHNDDAGDDDGVLSEQELDDAAAYGGGTPSYGSAPPAPPMVAGASPGSGRFTRRKKRLAVASADDAQQIQGFTDAVSGIAESVRDGLKHAAPDTVEIEFGLDIDVSSGVAVSLIADAHAKAAVRITLGWDNAMRRERDRYEPPSGETVLATPQYAWSDTSHPASQVPQQQPPYYGSAPTGA